MKQEIKDRILHTALERFNEDGFKEVTTDSLSKSIGISKKTLYTYFRSKEEIFETIYSNKNVVGLAEFDALINRIENEDNLNMLDELRNFANMGSRLKYRYSKLFFRDLKIYFPNLWKIELDLNTYYSRKGFDILWDKSFEKGIIKSTVTKELVFLMQSELFNRILDPELMQNIPGTIDDIIKGIIEIFCFGVIDPNKIIENKNITI